jgi:eukaryotic-like serine/threonine-protein kinase
MPLTPGTQIGSYEIVSAIGAGGMGEVWLAKDTRLERHVAIKVLPLELTRDPGRVRRFEQEARAASSLNHANVCTIYALGEAPDGRQFIAMELIEGTTLRARLSKASVPLRQAIDMATQIAAALAAAHAAGVVHRDVKPENVMLRPDGVVKMLDFGLAKLARPGGTAGLDVTRTTLQTSAGTVMGTIAYMSPEQASGQEVDARTDIWSLGVVLYELVAGRLPFGGASASEVLVSIIDREPTPLTRIVPNAPRELQRIVSKALRKDRDRRYQTAKDLFLDLQALGEDLGEDLDADSRLSSGPPPAAGVGTAPAVRRHKQLAAAAVAALLVLTGIGGWWAARPPVQETPTVQAPLTPRGLTRLTLDPGLQSDTTWSPDGRFIAYASDRAGNFDIWVQPLDGGAAVQLTKSPAHDRQPSWSPDGNTIVFRSDRAGGGLFSIPARGGAERQLTTFGAEPRWAPDGSRILFVSGTAYALLVPQMFTVRLDGQPPQQVLQPFLKNMRYVLSWNWFPDSKRVSLLGATTYGGEGLGIYTVPLSGEPAALLKYTPEVGADSTGHRLAALCTSTAAATRHTVSASSRSIPRP